MNKLVKVSEEQSLKIVAAIKEVEGKAEVNRMSFNKLIELTEFAEDLLDDLGIPLKSRVGSQFEYSPSGPYANAYKYAQGATKVKLLRKSSAWYLASVERGEVYPRAAEKNILKLTPVQRDIAITQFSKRFRVLPSLQP